MTDSDAAAVADWRFRSRRFSEERLLPLAEEMDRADRMPPELLDALRAEGFMGLGVPPEWGGTGGNARVLAAVLEELARGSAAVATFLSVHLSVCAHPIARSGSDAQKERFLRPLARGEFVGAFGLTEPGAGSDAAGLSSRYRREDGGFVLDGTKMFITNGARADVILFFATRDRSLGHRGISAFLLTKGTAGFSIGQHLDKLGLRGSETSELVLEHARLPVDALLGTEGEGLGIALTALTGGRVGIAACALGVARAGFEELRSAAEADPTDWKRARLARAHAEIESAAALIDRAARKKDAGEPFVEDASTAKLVAARAAVNVASSAVDVAGPASVTGRARAGRVYRDARVFPIVEGTTEIQELILGRTLVGR